jgi:hypothetical protein
VLLDGASVRWNAAQPVGSPVTVTYSFATASAYLTGSDASGLAAFTDSQIAAVRKAVADIAAVSNITFQEVPDTGASYGQIRFANNSQPATTAGYAY